jgi:hypothetical protein
MGLSLRGRKDWRPDWGLAAFILAGIALIRVALGLAFGHLDSAGLAACVPLGAGLGTLLHYMLSGPKKPET